MDIRQIIHGGPAACTLIGLLVSGCPSSAQGTFNIVGGLRPQLNANQVPLTVLETPVKRVSSPRDLINTLTSDFRGRVIVPHDVQWDLSGLGNIPLSPGVSLIGERGLLGSRPLLYTTNKGYMEPYYPLFEIKGGDVRVEGLHFRGPMADDRQNLHQYVNGITAIADPALKQGPPIVIADNEFDQWTGAAVGVAGPYAATTPELYDQLYKDLPRFTKDDAGFIRVERNYFHENAMDGGGYGVSLDNSVYVTIEGNVFDGNRHDVSSGGEAYSGYIARYNYVLQKGYWYGDSYYGQHFDVHGTADIDGDGTQDNSSHNGGAAGEYVEIAYNTIRGEQKSGGIAGHFDKTRAAFELRGRPSLGAFFHDNVLVHDHNEAFRLKTGDDPRLNSFSLATSNLHESGNRWDTDYSTEFATGDFDGDRRTDVFIATGTAWFFSRGGIRP